MSDEKLQDGKVTYCPPRLLRHPLAQAVLSTRKPHVVQRVVAEEHALLLDGGEDATGKATRVRLLAYLNRHWAEACEDGAGSSRRGLVISLHGWEGSSHSVYNLVLAHALLTAGYDVARLNLRDHGPNLQVSAHALNPGVFLGTLLEESHCAVQRLAEMAGDAPVYLIGPSMGGNFALRMAARAATHPIHNLRRVVAISPAVDPDHSTRKIDGHAFFHSYFRRRWLRSLLIKQRIFPDLYQFDPVAAIKPVWEMTDWLAQRYTDYGDAATYFARYRVTPELMAGLALPATVIAAADDPVIPPEDIRELGSSPWLSIEILDYGGHVGFVDWPMRRRLPELVLPHLTD